MKLCRTDAATRQTGFSPPVMAMSLISGVISMLHRAEYGSKIEREHSGLMPSALIKAISTDERLRLLGSPSSTLTLERSCFCLEKQQRTVPLPSTLQPN